jgi:hypothetical protein
MRYRSKLEAQSSKEKKKNPRNAAFGCLPADQKCPDEKHDNRRE